MKALITLMALMVISGCASMMGPECNEEPDGFRYCQDENGREYKEKMTFQEREAKRQRQKREVRAQQMAPLYFYYGASMLNSAGRSRSPQPLFGPVPMPGSAYHPQQQPYTIQGVNEDGRLEHTTIVPLGDGNYRYYTTGD